MSVCKTYLKPFTNLKDSYNHCVKTIVALKKARCEFYVGATAWPSYRALDHEDEKDMSSMFLLCEMSDLKTSEQMEKKVIKRFITKKYNINQSEGGEGLKNERNFLYVLLKKDQQNKISVIKNPAKRASKTNHSKKD